ncbi:putative phospholipase A(1) [Helianthus annuus]|nr:putative phospholipase A(1) [Helianthus annuus]
MSERSSCAAATFVKPHTTRSTTTRTPSMLAAVRYGKKIILPQSHAPTLPFRLPNRLVYYATAKISVPEAFFLRSLSREAWDRESNWIGYIATTTDEVSKALGRREIYIAWRGTSRIWSGLMF